MKFTWGHGITIAIILFMGYILSFVYRSFFNEVDLVAKDYYAQEVAYQDRIDQMANAQAVSDQIKVQSVSNGVMIEFPSTEEIDNESGTIHFFRPSDEEMDIKIPLSLDEENLQLIPSELLKPGRYKVNIAWASAGKGKYITKEIVR